jgi:hypothetical protein
MVLLLNTSVLQLFSFGIDHKKTGYIGTSSYHMFRYRVQKGHFRIYIYLESRLSHAYLHSSYM